jgi:hypothetical protein
MMTTNAEKGFAKPHSKLFPIRRLIAWLACAAMLLSLGCAAKQLKLLDQEKKAHQAGNYAVICEKTVDCAVEPDTCAQRYFLKGDACYALAKQKDPQFGQLTSQERAVVTSQHAEAAVNLEKGFAAASSWPLKGLQEPGRAQLYENLCDSLRFLFDERPSTELMARYLAAAKQYQAAEPDSIGGTLWYAKARYTSLGPLMHKTPEDTNPDALCRELFRIERDLNTIEDRASGNMRYQKFYQELQEQTRNQLKRFGCQL